MSTEPRDRALQALYEAERRGLEAPDTDGMTGKALRLTEGVTANLEDVDATIARLSTRWDPERMPVVDRTVLRLGVYELLHEDTPPNVVLSEAARLASAYSTQKSAPFVNGVLSALVDERARTTADPAD